MSSAGSAFITVAIAVGFYLVVPGLGAVLVRARWRRFRSAVEHAANLPVLDYELTHRAEDTNVEATLWGRLEAVQGESGIWVGDGNISLLVDLEHIPLYLIPHGPSATSRLPDETPRVLYWSELSALVEGTPMMVSGTVTVRYGSLVMVGARDRPPLVIIHDCNAAEVIGRALWTGRQRNEYWNHITPISLVAGSLASMLWALSAMSFSRLQAVFAFVAALVPILPLFPPGVLGFYWYRRLWRDARRIRAQRDVERVRQSARAPYNRRAWRRELVAVGLLLAAIGVNGYLAALLTALAIR